MTWSDHARITADRRSLGAEAGRHDAAGGRTGMDEGILVRHLVKNEKKEEVARSYIQGPARHGAPAYRVRSADSVRQALLFPRAAGLRPARPWRGHQLLLALAGPAALTVHPCGLARRVRL